MVRKRFFGHISGTEPPRTKIFALLGSSYMTRPWGNIKFFGALGAFVDFKKHAILNSFFIAFGRRMPSLSTTKLQSQVIFFKVSIFAP